MPRSRQSTLPGKPPRRGDSGVVHADFGTTGNQRIEIDALQLRAVRRRFMALNKDRLQRVQEGLERRQRQFIQLLPLLFHINHPMLPGYLSSKSPCGISDYAPGKRCIQTARKLARSFSYRRRAQRRYSIHAIYLMGSTGTIAYSNNSDFDIWICHRPGLPDEDQEALAQKASLIQGWAESLGLEVHFFIMDDEAFRRHQHQRLSNDSSGSCQHHLLLDEFYRTGLLVAGRYPIWWLVPPRYEARYEEYVRKLIVHRFIKPGDVIDFGSLHELPAGEFYGATLWQLYKAVDSPYKSILKILLMEAYANQHPDVDILAMRFKQAVHDGNCQLDRLDPYVMMCDTVEEYLLSRGEHERLDLARRCFYFKVNESLSRPSPRAARDWRRQAMQALVRRWGWGRNKLALLDQRSKWKIQRVLDERNRLVEELTRSYRSLSHFFRDRRDDDAIDPADLNLLGRKLYVAFERKAGKVELVNPGISADLSEEHLSLHLLDEDDKSGWTLYRGNVLPRETDRHEPLKQSSTLLGLLAWCHFNGLINRSACTLSVYPPEGRLSQWELRCVVDCLQQIFPGGRLPESGMHALGQPARIDNAALFVNLARDPMAKLTSQGKQLVSERIDPLSYGGQWENLAISFDLVAATTWGEVQTYSYGGRNALLECLCDYLAWAPLDCGTAPIDLACFSFSSSRGPIIARRLEALYRDVIGFFYHNSWRMQARYALRVGQRYFVLQPENKVPRYRELANEPALLDHLGEPQEDFSPIRFDAMTVQDSPLPVIMEHNRENRVQLFYILETGKAVVYILDERGSLHYDRVDFHDRLSLLGQYQRFLESVRFRLQSLAGQAGRGASVEVGEEYYQIARDGQDRFEVKQLAAAPLQGADRYLDIQVIGNPGDEGGESLTIYCDDSEFSSLEHGDRLYEAVAEHVLQKRPSRGGYPIYITDIDASSADPGCTTGLQTIHFLRCKKRIEARINAALQKLQRD